MRQFITSRFANHVAWHRFQLAPLFALVVLSGVCRAAAQEQTKAAAGNLLYPSSGTSTQACPRFDGVIIDPKGRGRLGYEYQIILDSPVRGADSSLQLVAGKSGIVVTALDLDGVGNDLDLIIKSAVTYVPLSIWINNHHGGFIRVLPNQYAVSVWSAESQFLPQELRDDFRGGLVLCHQFHSRFAACIALDGHEVEANLSCPPNFRIDPSFTGKLGQTRAPPFVYQT
jgi:hypothetical protein